jgi:predicted membrane protein
MNTNLTPQKVAIMAIFAAMYVALSFIQPIQIPVGIEGLTISPVALIATLFGLILGPYLGTASALLGATVSWAITGGSPYGLPFLLSPPLNAFVSGAIFYKKWKIAFAVLAVLIIAFPFTPPVLSMVDSMGSAQVAVWVLWDKIIALLLILPLAFFSKRLSAGHGAALFFILAFIGNQADNMWGSFIYAWPMVYNGIFGFTTEFVQLQFLAGPFLFPAIRLIEAFIAMIIAVPLIKVLSGTNWLWSKDNLLTTNGKPQINQSPAEAPT